MNLAIKEARPKDASLVALLAQVTFKEAFSHYWSDKEVLKKYFRTTFSVEKIKRSIAKKNNIFWIAFADELPVGYAKLKKHCPYEGIHDKSPAQLQKLYLLEDYIGNKIGTQLQDVVFEEVKKLGKKTIWLAVWDENDKGIRFYERHGFTKTAKYHFSFEHMEIDYEVMTKIFK